VIDATFASAKWRRALLDALSRYPAHVLFVETIADRNVLSERLAGREDAEDTGKSDARIEHLDDFLASYEPPGEIPNNMRITINTGEANENTSLSSILSEVVKKRIVLAKDFIKGQADRVGRLSA
jgi:predicted kinase